MLRATPVEGIENATRVGIGTAHACALRGTGQVDCWGDGQQNQLGDGTKVNRSKPAAVSGLTDAADLDVFEDHACAARSGGQVVCWGARVPWPGTPEGLEIATPRAVPGITDAKAVATHFQHTCALRRGGQVVCFGEPEMGRLGDPAATSQSALVTVRGLSGVESIALGNFGGCAVHNGGSLTCWGAGSITAWAPYKPGYQSPDPKKALAPAQLKSLSDAAGVGIFSLQACVVTRGGQARCWRIESFDMLPQNPLPAEAQVAGVDDASSIGGELCVRGGGSIWALQSDGENPFTARRLFPEITNAVRVTGTNDHGCAVLANGRVACWGGA